MELTKEQIEARLNYDPHTGIFTWKNCRKATYEGEVAGCLSSQGYIRIQLLGKSRLANRLAWVITYDEDITDETIDHKDRDKTNNRINNLRKATRLQQNINKIFRGTYRSGKKFCARIRYKGKDIHLGTYSTEEEAHKVYVAKKKELYGEWAP